jgi:hypothetical protein
MNEAAKITKENELMESPNCVAIIAILTEMARCVNQNLSKVRLTPINQAFTAGEAPKTAASSAQVSKA